MYHNFSQNGDNDEVLSVDAVDQVVAVVLEGL